MERFGCRAVSLSESFNDGLALLRVAEQRGLEGVVSKRSDVALPIRRVPGLAQDQDARLPQREQGAVAAV